MNNQVKCPSESDLAEFVSMHIDDGNEAADIALHIIHCDACHDKFLTIADQMVERKRIWEKFLSLAKQWTTWSAAAAEGATSADQQQSNLSRAKNPIIFMSDGVDEQNPDYWSAKLEFPCEPTPKSYLCFQEIKDGRNQPVTSGELTFLGVLLQIVNGEAEMPLTDFQRAIKNASDKDFIGLKKGNGRKMIMGYPHRDLCRMLEF